MTAITVRMPEDVVDDLKRVAPLLGFSGYQPLLRYYIGQGLRRDLDHLENSKTEKLVKSLKRHGVSPNIITEVLGEVSD